MGGVRNFVRFGSSSGSCCPISIYHVPVQSRQIGDCRVQVHAFSCSCGPIQRDDFLQRPPAPQCPLHQGEEVPEIPFPRAQPGVQPEQQVCNHGRAELPLDGGGTYRPHGAFEPAGEAEVAPVPPCAEGGVHRIAMGRDGIVDRLDSLAAARFVGMGQGVAPRGRGVADGGGAFRAKERSWGYGCKNMPKKLSL